jgi:3-oxo-5-alpha-steroid 4-dehydrogenase 1
MAEYLALVKQIDFEYLYTGTPYAFCLDLCYIHRLTDNPVTKRWFLWMFTLAGPVTLLYDAPFGRFATPDSVLSLDGITSWIAMELFSPLFFLVTAYLHPFSRTPLPLPSLSLPILGIKPQFVLTTLYFVHYLNRALISPLRAPYRARSHLLVVLSAIAFNTLNGFLLASFLTSASTASFLNHAPHSSSCCSLPRFWIGITLWALGFAGNLYHDEILLNIRRKAIAKGKAKELDSSSKEGQKGARQLYYAIPHGGLYALISFPNYLCEWVEWFGFALAASPIPDFALFPSANSLLAAAQSAQLAEMAQLLSPFVDSVSPPWLFFILEVVTMAPRAVRGHRWYHERFGESYPRDRRAIIPWLL